MKLFYSLFLVLISWLTFSQEKWTTQSGSIYFEASVPLFEEIKGQNNLVKCILNSKDKSIVCEVKIIDFEFKRDLMRNHFNEIYLESDKFPRAIFKGSIPNFDINKISTESTTLKINGIMKIHGVSKTMSVNGIFKKSKNQLELVANFILDTDDYEIEIPSIILPKISKKVQTQLNCILQ